MLLLFEADAEALGEIWLGPACLPVTDAASLALGALGARLDCGDVKLCLLPVDAGHPDPRTARVDDLTATTGHLAPQTHSQHTRTRGQPV